jgi:hypothetical protein
MIGGPVDLQMNVDTGFALLQRKDLGEGSTCDPAPDLYPYAERAILEDIKLRRRFGTGMESAFEIEIAAQFVEMA